MNITRSSLLFTVLTLTAAACGNNRLLVGDNPDAGPPPTGAAGTSGGAGTSGVNQGVAGTTGAAGITGVAGTTALPGTGAAGSTQSQVVKPLRISGDEVVYRLAHVIWNSLPDADLASQASLGVFKTTDDLHGAVRQLLADPRARAGVGAFYRWWLDLDRLATGVTKDPLLFPEFTPALAADMAHETETFGVNVTLDPNGTYQTLMTAPYTFATERLGAIYRVAGATGNTTFQRIELDTEQRAGLLTQPALQALGSLSTRNAPTIRGTYLMTRFLCRAVPEPPAGQPAPSPITPATTVRKWLEAEVHTQANCTACHGLLDPPGLAFETFDAIGRWRTTDNGAPVDVSGLRIVILPSGPTVNGPVQLANTLANSDVAQECMVRQWLSFALGRPLTDADEPSVSEATVAAARARFNLKELIVAVLSTDSFLAP